MHPRWVCVGSALGLDSPAQRQAAEREITSGDTTLGCALLMSLDEPGPSAPASQKVGGTQSGHGGARTDGSLLARAEVVSHRRPAPRPSRATFILHTGSCANLRDAVCTSIASPPLPPGCAALSSLGLRAAASSRESIDHTGQVQPKREGVRTLNASDVATGGSDRRGNGLEAGEHRL